MVCILHTSHLAEGPEQTAQCTMSTMHCGNGNTTPKYSNIRSYYIQLQCVQYNTDTYIILKVTWRSYRFCTSPLSTKENKLYWILLTRFYLLKVCSSMHAKLIIKNCVILKLKTISSSRYDIYFKAVQILSLITILMMTLSFGKFWLSFLHISKTKNTYFFSNTMV